MSRERLADAYDQLAEAYAQVALELRAPNDPAVARVAAVPDSVPTVPAVDAAGATPPAPAARRTPPSTESAFTRCPAHNVPWADGKYGKYCQQPSDDYPDWANDKGFCRVTPKNAGAWLAKHPRVAA